MKRQLHVILLSLVFFIWGFMTVLNDILIPWLKEQFQLNNTASMTVQLSFFGAYFLGSLLFYVLGKKEKDPVSLWGYRKTIALGLAVSATGTLLFLPAAYINLFVLYLLALFVLGFGFTLLQISCNPFMGLMGPPEGATARLNLAQGFNSLGTTISPLIGGTLLFGTLTGFDKIFLPYLIFTLILIVFAVTIWFSKIDEPASQKKDFNAKVLHIPQVRWAMLSIFCYVGAEVTIGSKLVELLQTQNLGAFSEMESKSLLSIYWGGALTGRFMASLQQKNSGIFRSTFMIATGASLMAGVLFLSGMDGHLQGLILWPFIAITLAHFVLSWLARFIDERQVLYFALTNAVLLLLMVLNRGEWLVYLILATGLFNSILWSHIFTLGIKNLKEKTSTASSLLVMMVVGGAVVPFVHGVLIDVLEAVRVNNAIQWSYIIAVPAYLLIAVYGFKYPQLKVRA